MIVLKFSKKDNRVNELEERLRQMSLAFKAEQVPGLQAVVLAEGQQKMEGHEAIHTHLDKLAGELHQWYYCNC